MLILFRFESDVTGIMYLAGSKAVGVDLILIGVHSTSF